MGSMLRKVRRNSLKEELGTNKIRGEFHRRYGYKPNITKQKLKLIDRLNKKIKKLLRINLRNKKKVKNEQQN